MPSDNGQVQSTSVGAALVVHNECRNLKECPPARFGENVKCTTDEHLSAKKDLEEQYLAYI